MSKLVCITCEIGIRESSLKIKEWDSIEVVGKPNNYALKYSHGINESCWWEGGSYLYMPDGGLPKHDSKYIQKSINNRSCIIDNEVSTKKYIMFRDPDIVSASIYCKEEDVATYKQIILTQLKEYLTQSVFNYMDAINTLSTIK